MFKSKKYKRKLQVVKQNIAMFAVYQIGFVAIPLLVFFDWLKNGY